MADNWMNHNELSAQQLVHYASVFGNNGSDAFENHLIRQLGVALAAATTDISGVEVATFLHGWIDRVQAGVEASVTLTTPDQVDAFHVVAAAVDDYLAGRYPRDYNQGDPT